MEKILSFLLALAVLPVSAYEHRDLFMKACSDAGTEVFMMDGKWLPYPEYSDREGWDALLGENRAMVIRKGEEYLDYEWKTVPATAYLAYERTGERGIMETPLGLNRRAINALLLAELAEGKGRFIDQLVNGLWLSCQMPSWVLSAHLPRQETGRSLPDPRHQIIDLGSAGYAAIIAMAYHYFHVEFDRIDPSINYCIRTSMKEKILDPFLDESVRGGNWWMAWKWRPGILVNNWNPWCNSNVILCFLLMETDRERLDKAIALSLESVDQFVNYVKGDGACEEGPSYWEAAGAKLYDYAQIIHDASCGKVSIMDSRLLRDMGEYIVRSYIGDGWVVNFADASAKLKMDPVLIYRFGKAVGSSEMTDFAYSCIADRKAGRFVAPKPVIWNDIYRSLESVTACSSMREGADSLNRLAGQSSFGTVLAGLSSGVPACTWYPETEFAYLRNDDGWFVAAKGGHNNESHNHNDIGTFTLFIDNVPVFVDAGVETYTKKTFSMERYTIWTMQSDWHNLPAINGTSQIAGADFRARNTSCSLRRLAFSADIAGAYSEAAECISWTRSYRLKQGSFEIRDSYSLKRRVMPDVENFLVQGEVYLPGEPVPGAGDVPGGSIVVRNGDVSVKMAFPSCLVPSVEEVQIEDRRLSVVWGPVLRRISFVSAPDAPLTGTYSFKVVRL